MEDSQKSDQELLQCSPRIDTSTLPKALANKIAQNYGIYNMQILSDETICTDFFFVLKIKFK